MRTHALARRETDDSPERRPLVNAATLRSTDSPVSQLFAAGLAIVLCVGLPELRLVLLAVPGGGAILGALLGWKHQ